MFNSNGIETHNGKKGHLILVNSTTGKLYGVDGKSGLTKEIVISNGNVISGDGLYRRGNTLYVVQNVLNQISELELSDHGSAARIVRIMTHPDFQIPTTITGFAGGLYAINARFDVAPPRF